MMDPVREGDVAERTHAADALPSGDDGSQTLPEAILESVRIPRVPHSNFVGRKIGQYTLIRLLGEGGMGAVYQAEQMEPVRRIVALKIIRNGMDSALAVARFELERQVLAMMDHENIAKVFDGGTTPEGQPYFTMELIKGVPITKYCDGMEFTLRARMELFVKVCRAIQHAHQRGIIHRDIKPENVLVTLKDDKPLPKIIDFGLARSSNNSHSDLALTIAGGVVGTLEYMSPEQAELNTLGVDTRTDVYSLGVLLYELITGATPLAETRKQGMPLLELLRAIRENDPILPSRRLSSSAGSLPELASKRGTQPTHLTRQVSEELDWIAMKALEKDRARRYATPFDLGQDVERFLNDEAVEACPPSSWYRFKKIVRRNKVIFLAAGVAVLALVLGLGAALWQAQRAEAALRDLRGAAPHYFTESQQLAADGKLEEARAKIEFALHLIPDQQSWWLYRAHILLALKDYSEAVDAYHQVLAKNPADIAAVTNLKCCELFIQHAHSAKTASSCDVELLRQLKAVDLAWPSRMNDDAWEQIRRRFIMAEQFGQKFETLFTSLRKQGASDWDLIADVKITDGKLEINLNYNENGRNKFKAKSLSFIEGLPILKLKLSNSAVSSLQPLTGSEIEYLELWGCPVRDVSPLGDCKALRYLGIAETDVKDIQPLTSLKLEELRMRMADVDDVTPLAACKSLERIELPDPNVRGVPALRNLPNLQRIGYDCPNGQIRFTAEEFWREFDRRKQK